MSGHVGEIVVTEIPNANLGGVATSAFAELTFRSAADYRPPVDIGVSALPRAELRYAGSLAGTSQVELGDRQETPVDRDHAMAA